METMTNFLRHRKWAALGIAICISLVLVSIALSAQSRSQPLVAPAKLAPAGERYQAVVPDTLDLAERARLSVHGLTSFLDPAAGYAPYGHTYLNANPPYMSDLPGGPPNWGKIVESLIMARLVCGSEENLGIDAKTLDGMLSSSWMTVNPVAPTPVSRAMLALMAIYQLDPTPGLKALVDRMAEAHCAAAKREGDGAFYSDPPADTADTGIGVLGRWFPVFVNGCAIRALTRWSEMTGEPKYLDMAGSLTKFIAGPKFWTPEAAPKAVCAAEHGQFTGHLHGYTQCLMGLLCYANATNDAHLKEFVRESYEYLRNFGIARIGLFGEGCATGDMTYLAIKLSDTGVGDYWEDADQYIRNHLAELQLTDAGRLRKATEQMPPGRGKNDTTKGPLDPKNETADRVIERNLGVFLSDSTHPTLIPDHSLLYTICCTGNCTVALYAAWESIVRCKDDSAQVNLLLNRASKWLDIDSYLPYEGKVVIRDKTARRLSVRMPRWVDKRAVRSRLNGRVAGPFWVGQYLVFDSLRPKDVVVITFPVVETTEKYTLKWYQSEFWKESTNPGNAWQPASEPVQYTCRFRGNTLVDISPRDQGIGYPLYLRDGMRQAKAPMKKVTRHIPTVTLRW
jgi:hypothetical protein